MGYKNREIEVKLLTTGMSLKKLKHRLNILFAKDSVRQLEDTSSDFYFRPSGGEGADFLRVREQSSGGGVVLTVKHTDKESTMDRVEVDVNCQSSQKQVMDLLQRALGAPLGEVRKKYVVYFLDDKEEGSTVSLYQIKGDERVFIEVEDRSEAKVFRIIARIEAALKTEAVGLEVIGSSLYQMFVLKEEMIRSSLVVFLIKP